MQGCASAWRRYAWFVCGGSVMCVQGSQVYCVCMDVRGACAQMF